MPAWLNTTIGVLTGLAAFSVLVSPIGKLVKGAFDGLRGDVHCMSQKVNGIHEHFDEGSEVSKALGGTLPHRLRKVELNLEVE